MSNQRLQFFRHVAQTSSAPLAIEVRKAKGSELTDRFGKKYIDLIAGISVCNIGHRHPDVVKAIRKQAGQYLHVLVYGEMVETPQVEYARLLVRHLPKSLDMVYFTNSGAEAIEGAMKLAKRVTGRTQIIAFSQSYHGSTQGALSIMGDEYWRNAYRPLLPDILHLEYNDFSSLDQITERAACVVMETVQAERGVVVPDRKWMKALRKKCSECGVMLVLDEIQTGFGRTGTLWGFEQFGIKPDILVLGKALGGGMPLGAFIAPRKQMLELTRQPVLGHITTFGGHPVCCAAGLAAFKALLREKWIDKVAKREQRFRQLLQHPAVKSIRSRGLLMALELSNREQVKSVVDYGIKHGVLTDWFLFAPHCLRIAPPLSISVKEMDKACRVLVKALQQISELPLRG